jgi:hypothetical protein
MSEFVLKKSKEVRKQVKLRIGVSSASGFGKTFGSLRLAYGICGDWDKIAVIDTENESGSLYCDRLGNYNVITLKPPFSPERYIEAIKACENAGMEVIIIDSISHEWEGAGGVLELHAEQTQKEFGKNSYTAWAKITPRHNKFLQKILQSTCHIITTSRRKQDYEMFKTDDGKTKIQKLGTKEITREGFEYELMINFEIYDNNHYARASKDRSSLFADRDAFILTEEIGKELIDWANRGTNPTEEAINVLNLAKDHKELAEAWKEIPNYVKNEVVTETYRRKFEGLRSPIDEATLAKMLQFIADGKSETVKNALQKYILTEEQQETINKAMTETTAA